MKRCYRELNERKSRRRLDMWTDETRIQKSHKGWSLCGVPVSREGWIGLRCVSTIRVQVHRIADEIHLQNIIFLD